VACHELIELGADLLPRDEYHPDKRAPTFKIGHVNVSM